MRHPTLTVLVLVAGFAFDITSASRETHLVPGLGDVVNEQIVVGGGGVINALKNGIFVICPCGSRTRPARTRPSP